MAEQEERDLARLMHLIRRVNLIKKFVKMPENQPTQKPQDCQIELNRDNFTRTLIRELSGSLEDIVGIEEASGYISMVGKIMGDQIGRSYLESMKLDRLSVDQMKEVFVDLKRRIEGDFYVIESSEEKIVLGNRRCPFEEKVIGRESMCMMTSNVFGSIASQSFGYAKVSLNETIARGDVECRVTIFLKPTNEAKNAAGREYFAVVEHEEPS